MEWMLKGTRFGHDAERADIHLALGKAYDDLREYQQAIRHFDAGNNIKHRAFGSYVATAHAATVDRIIATFTADFFSQNAALGSDWEVPVLILGMPRSGF